MNAAPTTSDSPRRMETQLQQVVINALAGQTLYATVTMTQGAHTHEVDLRLSEG